MARVPTEAEIEAMSEDELEAFLSGDQDPGGRPQGDAALHPAVAPGGWQATSGAPRTYAWLLVVASVIGVAACWELMVSELRQLREPLAELSCDINPLVSCGASLNVWQGNLLGVPNSFVGAMAFAVLLVVGLLLASGHRLPRWVWWGLITKIGRASCRERV